VSLAVVGRGWGTPVGVVHEADEPLPWLFAVPGEDQPDSIEVPAGTFERLGVRALPLVAFVRDDIVLEASTDTESREGRLRDRGEGAQLCCSARHDGAVADCRRRTEARVLDDQARRAVDEPRSARRDGHRNRP
jgi:hypothetical protein